MEKFLMTGDAQLEQALVKIVAEQNQEKYLVYDVASDVASYSAVENGRVVLKETIENYMTDEALTYGRVATEDIPIFRRELKTCLKRPASRIFDVRYLNKEREKIWYRIFLVSVADENRKVYKLGAKIICIHKEKIAAENLRKQAQQDSLTGVYNHQNYENLCRELIRKNSDGLLFMMVDIDDFKQINDTYGHHAGDSIIKQVGQVLAKAVKDIGIAGRIGGDEFSVCLSNIWDKQTALEIAMRIREELKHSQEGVTFSISVGATRSNGRVCSFEQLYFEADEALYFVKDNGKNQIVFSDELEEKRQARAVISRANTPQTDEEIELDDSKMAQIVVSPGSKRVEYINKAAREMLRIDLEEAKSMPCYELLHSQCTECKRCELYIQSVEVLSDEESAMLRSRVPNGRFMLYSRYMQWKGEPARISTLMNLHDNLEVEMSYAKEMQRKQMLFKCWNILHKTNVQNTDYSGVLQILNEYHDADCSVILTKENGVYKHVLEYHKPSAANVIEGVFRSVKAGIFEDMEVLIDEDGLMRPRHIKKKLENHPELVPFLEQGLVHSTIGIKLARQEDFAGILMVINPSHNETDVMALRMLEVFLTPDLLRKQISDAKDYEYSHDMLTSLWSRSFFGEWQAKYRFLFGQNFGVFTADIFGMGKINREYGFENGNQRIIRVAELFKTVFAGYSVFRYDADQILVACHDIEKEDFEKLIRYFKERAEELDIELAMGYSWMLEGDIMQAIREANEYMLQDKSRLENNNNSESKNVKYMESALQEEIKKGNFHVYLQPKVRIATGKTIGAEALTRLYDDVRGFISPAYFIPLLEEKGMIHMVDLFVLEEVFKFQKRAIEEGKEVVPISVNFSKNTLMIDYLTDFIRDLYHKYPIPDGLIQIEITETISTMEHITVNKIANTLRGMGFSVAMDDFGTNYSNMSVLTQFEFDAVKLDRSLILGVETNKKSEAILRHTISMLKELGIETIMEGIETAEQVEILKRFGCEIVQGYFYGRPEPHQKFYELFMNKDMNQ